ncbi:hypothetical protein FCN77_12185 [Arthrobacter sp. 24S4-2]|uniref:hypothetical protein n=1 Tax=Arthrobacter sp. 24S4-2 TaxID=2575374 RepID=UPI0010C79684|nr:hypothetical protein [Arthrobacter sp. 24S4-2]QCO98313.1 hypothetical protein FCN77_12185 [Arthrobacter sp. 24S4-2]
MTETAFEKTEVVIREARELGDALDSGIRSLQATALAHGTAGILVTKLAPGRFTLELSHDVPFGYTYEKA